MSGRRVVITGMGSISALGHDSKQQWQAMREDRVGIEGDDGGGMHAGGKFLFRKEERKHFGKSDPSVRDFDQRLLARRKFLVHQDG